MLIVVLAPLVLVTLAYGALLLRAALAARAIPTPEAIVLGAVTNFFDTLGIGSFAPTMAWFKFRNLVPDRLIPSTMLVGHTFPAMIEANIFLVILGVFVDPMLLVSCVIALVAGAVLGAPLAVKSRVWIVQTFVAAALLVAAVMYTLSNLHLMPGGGTASSLSPELTVVAVIANFVFGVLLNFGIGNYAPTLAMLSLMGMDPRLTFPIMAAGAAFAGAGASMRYLAMGKIDLRIAGGLALGGVPAVLVAAFLVKNMPVEILRWLVIAVVIYAAMVMVRAAAIEHSAERARLAASPA